MTCILACHLKPLSSNFEPKLMGSSDIHVRFQGFMESRDVPGYLPFVNLLIFNT